MIRIIFLLIILILIVLIIYWLWKTLFTSKKTNKYRYIGRNSVADELLKLQNLLEEGVIDEKEFEKLKKKLLE